MIWKLDSAIHLGIENLFEIVRQDMLTGSNNLDYNKDTPPLGGILWGETRKSGESYETEI